MNCGYRAVFLNRRAAARYRALASIIPGRETPEETAVCYKISLAQLITNLNVILYLSTCHTVYISVLTLNLLMTTIVAPPSNASKWQMGFNSAFKGLIFLKNMA